jgi:predicted ATP-dependent protease
VIREASWWAAQRGWPRLGHARRGGDRARRDRVALSHDKMFEAITEGTLLLDVTGARIGQVNGLVVFEMGDHEFGIPSRITASLSMGRAGIVNIEREADMSGPTHDKGVLILAGYLRLMFAQDRPLTLSASLAFEQSYGSVDGDSASSAEMYALLSALAGVPIRQGFAVTGSVNQMGEIQPIGGVNEKIEGWFAACRARGG